MARVDITPATALSLTSGTTATLTAAAYTRDNRSLGNNGITWSSSNESVASVADGVVTAKLVGSANITASIGGISSGAVSVSVTPGAATQLGLRVQPNGANSGTAFLSQPVVEVRDAAGNVVTTAGQTITVSLASGGGTLSGTTSAIAVNGVATFNGLSLSGTIGPRTLTFSTPGLSPVTSNTFNLAPGTPTTLAIRTQPIASTAYVRFPTPAVVELRDDAGNISPANAPVTAIIASGGGTLGGDATILPTNGVATFTTLTVNGSGGPRTLQFSSPNLTSVTTASFDVAEAPPAVIAPASNTPSLTVITGPYTASIDIPVTNGGVVPLTNLAVQSITYGAGGSGWLTATFPSGPNAPTKLRLTASGASLAVGSYSATIVLSGSAPATTSLTLTVKVVPDLIDAYGTAANKVSLVNVGAALSPGFVTTERQSGTQVTPDASVTYTSRIPSIATVNAAGQITAVGPGETWIVATSAIYNGDSVLVIVPKPSGVILQTDLTNFNNKIGDVITMKVLIDTRGATLGAATVTLSWSPVVGTTPVFGSLDFVDVNTTAGPMTVTTSFDPDLNILRITGASANGVTGVVTLATVRLNVTDAAKNILYFNAVELLGPDLSNLLPTATVTQYPVISK